MSAGCVVRNVANLFSQLDHVSTMDCGILLYNTTPFMVLSVTCTICKQPKLDAYNH